MNAPGPRKRTGAWWRYPIALALLLIAAPVWGLGWLLNTVALGVTIAGERLSDLIDLLI